MNKDAVLATIIGFGVGLIIAGLVFLAPALVKDMPSISLPDLSFLSTIIQGNKNPQPTPKVTPISHAFTVASPLDESVELREEVLISGTTAPESMVVLEDETNELVVLANTKGAYAGKLTLSEGKNVLTVTSYANKKTETKTVTVYYTPEPF